MAVKVQLPLSVLFDANLAISNGFDKFGTEYNGGKTERDIQALDSIDSNGILQ